MRILVALLTLLTASPAFAGSLYKYVDESGRVVFSNIGVDRAPQKADVPKGRLPKLPKLPKSKAEVPVPLTAQLSPEELYTPLIEEVAKKHSVDSNLVKAIIRVESNFDPDAVSSKGCKGLMQLLPATATRFGVSDIFDPAQNIEGGTKFLRFLLDYFKNDISLVAAAYNAGENAVARHGGIPPYRETRDYVRKVTALYTPSEPVGEMAAVVEQPTISRKIYRVVQPDGSVLFTNAPTQALRD